MDRGDSWADSRGDGNVRALRRGRPGENRSSSAEGRVPPHNLQAEEAVLGAILLSREALSSVVEVGLRFDDFYKPAHQHIYDVAYAVSQSGRPADTITVGDELERAGLLESIGGLDTLHGLQNSTPAISNAAHYARIVQDAAMLRRLIMVAGDISELAYSGPDDVDSVLDEVETKVFKVADRRVADTYAAISELMAAAVERIEENYERKSSITGVPTGYNDLDELLSGLQPSTLNIVGARPAMGKCVRWDTPIVDVATGEVVTAARLLELTEQRGALELPALDAAGGLCRARVSACIDDGVKPVFTVRTRSGRSVTVTASHPLLTGRGWRRLADIEVGEFIAAPSGLPVFGTDDLPDAEIDLLAAQLGKHVPAAVFRLPRERVARFLNRLFATDGTAWVAAAGYARIGYATVSGQLADDLRHLLLRFGIGAKLRRRAVLDRGERQTAFEIEIMDAPSMLRFVDEIGIVGKEAAVAAVRRTAERARVGWSVDTIPAEVWDDIDKARGDITWAEINRRCGRPPSHNFHAGRRGPLRRETVALLAAALDDEQLRWWASTDITWDRIVSIEAVGEDRVIDFSVPELHNFVAADVYLHNTAFGLGMAVNIAKKTRRPVLVFSLEMGHVELTQRILSSEAEVDSTKIRSGQLTEPDWRSIGQAIGRLEVPLFLDENPRVTVMEIRAKARRVKMQQGDLGLILIDYLQLMTGNGASENRQLEVSEISRNLKILARELEVPIVALSQLSRNLESRGDKKPMLSDLRESGSLEQDADVVMFLYRDEVYNRESPDRGAADVIIAKHRAGPIGDVRLVFRGQYARFDNAAPRSLGP